MHVVFRWVSRESICEVLKHPWVREKTVFPGTPPRDRGFQVLGPRAVVGVDGETEGALLSQLSSFGLLLHCGLQPLPSLCFGQTLKKYSFEGALILWACHGCQVSENRPLHVIFSKEMRLRKTPGCNWQVGGRTTLRTLSLQTLTRCILPPSALKTLAKNQDLWQWLKLSA